MKKMMSISEFARISSVCRKTLIWYDNTGLFKPAFTDSKGYRHYSYEQIYTISVIQMLLELGVSHAQIKDYMQMNSPEKERRMLCTQEKMIRDEIAKLSGALDVITTRLGSIDEAESNSTGISIKHLPASPVFISHSLNGISRTDISDDTWMEFYAACEENGNSFGYPEGFMIKEESIRMGASDNIDHIVSYVGNLRYANAEMPEGDYAVYHGNGSIDDTAAAYMELKAFIDRHGLGMAGQAWEKRLIDESGTDDKGKQRIRIAILISQNTSGNSL